ncbi:tail fiber protein [Campylobacter sp. RM12920]|uniref:Tail fiber protein n=1 Tax=Campylobacter californiensis TaxID=1032243 RepID=A0ABD4JG40_9BACT|nr:tail fiber protein [Campylobacter sp. RM12919]MBE2987414.1 tail fiber protein [Campylobacter sp. RM12920]
MDKIKNGTGLEVRNQINTELERLGAALTAVAGKADTIENALNTKLNAEDTAADSQRLGNIEASKYALKSDISDGLKIGSYLLWSSESTTPAGFLVCDGRSLAKSEYPELFAVIGYTYGGSEESFNIPTFNDGRFMRSLGGNALPLGELQQDEIKKHSHNFYTSKANTAASGGNWYGHPSLTLNNPTSETGGDETRPTNSSVVVLIKAKDVKEATQSEIDDTPYATEAKAGIVKLKNSINGNAEDSAVTEKAIKDFIDNGFLNLKSDNGYTKLPNGFIMQWGIISTDFRIASNDIIFPIAFPNACFGGWWSTNKNHGASEGTSLLKEFTNSGMVFENWLGASAHVRWFAIGH